MKLSCNAVQVLDDICKIFRAVVFSSILWFEKIKCIVGVLVCVRAHRAHRAMIVYKIAICTFILKSVYWAIRVDRTRTHQPETDLTLIHGNALCKNFQIFPKFDVNAFDFQFMEHPKFGGSSVPNSRFQQEKQHTHTQHQYGWKWNHLVAV